MSGTDKRLRDEPEMLAWLLEAPRPYAECRGLVFDELVRKGYVTLVSGGMVDITRIGREAVSLRLPRTQEDTEISIRVSDQQVLRIRNTAGSSEVVLELGDGDAAKCLGIIADAINLLRRG